MKQRPPPLRLSFVTMLTWASAACAGSVLPAGPGSSSDGGDDTTMTTDPSSAADAGRTQAGDGDQPGNARDADVSSESDAGAPDDVDAGSTPSDAGTPPSPPACGAEDSSIEATLVRSCGHCHGASNPKLALLSFDGSLDRESVQQRAEDMLARMRSTQRPMPPYNAPASASITEDERTQLECYVSELMQQASP
jgi:hypothetical protein